MAQGSAADLGDAMDGRHRNKQDEVRVTSEPGETVASMIKTREPSMLTTIALLSSLIPFGLLSMHVLTHRNGYYASMVHLRDFGPHLLPGTQDPLVRRYTGNGVLDYWLTVLVCFFANAVDGSEPELSVLCVMFAANMGPCMLLVYVESLGRRSSRGVLWFACLWCLSMQTISFGLTMPAYCIVSLLTGRLLGSRSIQPQNGSNSIRALRSLPLSMTLGYIMPTILMCYRGFSSPVHQYLLAFWQPFPLWVALIQILLVMGASSSWRSRYQTKVKTRKILKISIPHPMLWIGSKSPFLQYESLVRTNRARMPTLHALAFATDFASYSAASLHWITLSVLVLSKFAPNTAAVLGIPEVSILRTFMPANPFSPVKITAMPQGVLAFLQYDLYIGITAALIWTAFRQHELEILMGISSQGWVSIWRLFINVIIFGPGATVAGFAYLQQAELQLMAMHRLELRDEKQGT